MYTLKKSLGQHFLKDENMCKQIVATIQEKPFTQLLEVGPGAGAITKFLLQIPNIDFKAVELDDEKVAYLETNFPSIKGKIIHKDFLHIDCPFENNFTLVGNFPYNISTQILFKVLDWRTQVESVIGMFQKEVAQRAASKEGNKVYGVLSVLIQAFYDVEYLYDVLPNSFNPPPKVMSSIIRLTPRKEALHMKTEKMFFMLVKMAFNQRRKMLRNAVKSLFDETTLQDPIFDKRAEALNLAQFAELTFRMKTA